MKKRSLAYLLMLFLFLSLTPAVVRADSAPSPRIQVHFEGMESETYFVTLLVLPDDWDERDGMNNFDGNDERQIWEKFNAFSDPDRYRFTGSFENCSQTHSYTWGSIPPQQYKILIYFPEHDKLAISAPCRPYAFSSYYTITVDKDDFSVSNQTVLGLSVRRSYDYTSEIISMLLRIFLTIAVEFGIAWICGFRSRNQVIVILVTNILTQTILNVLLNLIGYRYGLLNLILNYVWVEIVVFLIEGVVYARLLPRFSENPVREKSPWVYAAVANTASFFAGELIACIFPAFH